MAQSASNSSLPKAPTPISTWQWAHFSSVNILARPPSVILPLVCRFSTSTCMFRAPKLKSGSFEAKRICFVTAPCFMVVSICTVKCEDLPGGISALFQDRSVQPQSLFTSNIRKGLRPSLKKVKSATRSLPSSTCPRFLLKASNLSTALFFV
ncbi:MAG: hypothetical protein BWY75_02873 [bacterium ADurb.Bin425]|nr:MAG: hypothetical protein BWY75_02873 [bacterium ADurb.Bin425]